MIWKERSLELDEIHDSMPTPSGVYFGAKLTALLLVIAVWLFGGALALVGLQLASGYDDLELGLYARGAALAAVYPILMMVLACFCHVVARSKLAGYGLVFLFIISWDLREEFGFEHHLYRFASLPPPPLLRPLRLRAIPRAVRLVQPLLGVHGARARRVLAPVLEEGVPTTPGGRDGSGRAHGSAALFAR